MGLDAGLKPFGPTVVSVFHIPLGGIPVSFWLSATGGHGNWARLGTVDRKRDRQTDRRSDTRTWFGTAKRLPCGASSATGAL